MDLLPLKIKEGVTIAVLPNLKSTTTYVLLEQETWFEKELSFVMRFLRPGMTVVDIGANAGVYSLAMARAVGPGGRVFAFEPGSATRRLLETGRTLNGADNLEILGDAVSDGERTGHLQHGHSSELHALGEATESAEAVTITSLDAAASHHRWPSIDLLKIDAEGEEERILTGARRLLAESNPLVILETRVGETSNPRLRGLIESMGYRSFRVLPGMPLLVPLAAGPPIDDFELNLVAAKPQTIATLVQRGLLVEEIPAWKAGATDRDRGMALIRSQAYADAFSFIRNPRIPDSSYAEALAAYAVWRSPDEDLPRRVGALAFAAATLKELCARSSSMARLSTWARAASDWGERSQSSMTARRVVEAIQKPGTVLNEPFWPASARFDLVRPMGDPGVWFAASAGEQVEAARAFSSHFGGGSPVLKWLCTLPYRTPEHLRRAFLLMTAAGNRPTVPPALLQASPDHLNAAVWQAGQVPGVSS